MIKRCFALLTLIFCTCMAQAESCNDIKGRQAHAPLRTWAGEVCFIIHPIEGIKEEIDAVSMYLIPVGGKPVKADGRGLLYDAAPGKIIDAFLLDINNDKNDEVIVINSVEVRYTLVEPNSSGFFYSVDVFELTNTTLKRDEQATNWFGSQYSWLKYGKDVYKYPFLNRSSIIKALSLPYISLMYHDDAIPAKVKHKAHLYRSDQLNEKTNKYLIAGDKVSVLQHNAGWCRVSYTDGKKPLTMWMQCDEISDVPED